MLVETYNKFGKFDEEQRNSLITLIAKFFEDKSLKMSSAASYKIEREILERFPSEKLEYYRTSKRGRLYAKYCNITASFKKGVLKQVAEGTKKKTERTKSRHEEVLEQKNSGFILVNKIKYKVENLRSTFDKFFDDADAKITAINLNVSEHNSEKRVRKDLPN
ncbi:hypothetical protein RN001_015274 [Aquatica leii]|uniref:Uncharacterized protein n=1 Tax=Aquatica leii TaxID=1421715 RepID=A0AAN7PZ75_9COLE|nr:hypothetical protein RN001_015274 [Aquatica leii]